MQDKENYARTRGTNHRNISPRFAEFINKLRTSCQNILKLPDCKRKEDTKDFLIDVEVVRSRWEAAHTRHGVCVELVKSVRG